MSDVEAVVGLLERWRDASGVGRVRIGFDATRTIGELPADRKRALAIEVAQRVAPQLVPAIEAESGDLSGEQVAAVIDLIRRADREQLDQLIDALRSVDVLAAADLVDDAVDVLAPPDPATAALLDDIAEPDAPPEPDERGGDEPGIGAAAAAVAAAGDALAHLDADEVEVAADGTLELDEAAVRANAEAEARARAERWQDTSRSVPTGPAYRAPAMDFGLEFDLGDDDLPDPTVTAVAPLEQRRSSLPGVTSGAGGVGDVPAAPAPLGRGPVTAVVAAITATPDGYQRRRAAMAAIRDDRLERADVVTVVTSLARDTDRSWVAGAALDAGLVGAGDVDDLGLTVAAARRLRRRAS